MTERIYICGIKGEYTEYLRQYDDTVRIDVTGTRKYLGVLFEVSGHKYYAPLAHPRKKHSNISDEALDCYKLDKGNLGVINLNNMIPVPDSMIVRINIEEETDYKYKNLLRNQARIIMAERKAIMEKASVLYSVVNSGQQPILNRRCSKYKLLEEKCAIYGIVGVQVAPTKETDNS